MALSPAYMQHDIVEVPELTPRDYQVPLWRAMDEGCKRAVAVWHRRAGKDICTINLTVVKAIERTGTYYHCLPTYNQGRKIVWDGMTKDGRPFISYIPGPLIASKKQQEMQIRLTNGSIWQIIGTDDIDRVVGTNPLGIVFSEYSLHHPRAWDYFRPILRENGGWAIFLYTPRGRNHAHELYARSVALSRDYPHIWFSELLTVDDTNVVTSEDIEQDRREGMSEDMIQQEYYCSWDLGAEGAYWARLMTDALHEGRICRLYPDPHAVVHTAWDLGVKDATAIWFFRMVGREIHFVDYYESVGYGIVHYAQVLDELRRKHGYLYGTHFGPHDLEKREYGSSRDASGIPLKIRESAKKAGIDFSVLPPLAVQDGIELVRGILPRCYFDEKKCAAGIRALESYRKEYDEKRKVYYNTPLHDWASNGADAMRYAAMAITGQVMGKRARGVMSVEEIRRLEARYAKPPGV